MGDNRTVLHHIDGDRNNHAPENLRRVLWSEINDPSSWDDPDFAEVEPPPHRRWVLGEIDIATGNRLTATEVDERLREAYKLAEPYVDMAWDRPSGGYYSIPRPKKPTDNELARAKAYSELAARICKNNAEDRALKASEAREAEKLQEEAEATPADPAPSVAIPGPIAPVFHEDISLDGWRARILAMKAPRYDGQS